MQEKERKCILTDTLNPFFLRKKCMEPQNSILGYVLPLKLDGKAYQLWYDTFYLGESVYKYIFLSNSFDFPQPVLH